MKQGGKGGALTKTGLYFERKADLRVLLGAIDGYEVKGISGKAGKGIFFKSKLVARSFQKNEYYTFLNEEGIDWRTKLSKRLIPDDALLIIVRETLFIIEIKTQKVAGSVDEKLQTCDFKRKQHQKLVLDIGLKVEYVYVLDEWFKQPSYKDVLEYISSVNCHYKFGTIPLAWLGLPS